MKETPEFVLGRASGLSVEKGSVFGTLQAGLEGVDDRAEETRREKAGAQRTGRILTDWRKLP